MNRRGFFQRCAAVVAAFWFGKAIASPRDSVLIHQGNTQRTKMVSAQTQLLYVQDVPTKRFFRYNCSLQEWQHADGIEGPWEKIPGKYMKMETFATGSGSTISCEIVTTDGRKVIDTLVHRQLT